MSNREISAAIPDQIRHGFLNATELHSLKLGEVRGYQQAKSHTGFTLFGSDGESCVYIQMYALPAGASKLKKDLEFQVAREKWGKSANANVLKLDIFPADWVHTAYWLNPKRTIHLYQGLTQAVFIRYTGKSLRDSLLQEFNKHLRFLKKSWHTELVDHVLTPPSEDDPESDTIVDAIDLRVEEAAIRKMILGGI